MIIIFILLILGYLAGWAKVETNHYAFPVWFNVKSKRVYGEGWYFIGFFFIFFGKMWQFSVDLETESMEDHYGALVISKDNLELQIDGSFQYRSDKDNLHVLSQTTVETICKGIKDAIEEGLGKIAGIFDAVNFSARKEEIALLINCLFGLSRRPDYYINKDNPTDFNTNLPESFKKYLESLRRANDWHNGTDVYLWEQVNTKINKLDPRTPGTPSPGMWKIPLETDEVETSPGTVVKMVRVPYALAVLDFYKQNVTKIVNMLELSELIDEKSPTEQRYGIQIETYTLAKVKYSPKTMESLEGIKQAKNKAEAAAALQKRKLELMKEFIALGVSPNHASDDADALLGIAPKQTFSGGGNVLPVVNMPGAAPASSSSHSKKP